MGVGAVAVCGTRNLTANLAKNTMQDLENLTEPNYEPEVFDPHWVRLEEDDFSS